MAPALDPFLITKDILQAHIDTILQTFTSTIMNKSQRDVSSASNNTESAPWLPIPSRAVSAIEHPCIIKNVDKGITSLGGSLRLSKVRGQTEVPHTVANAHSRV